MIHARKKEKFHSLKAYDYKKGTSDPLFYEKKNPRLSGSPWKPMRIFTGIKLMRLKKTRSPIRTTSSSPFSSILWIIWSNFSSMEIRKINEGFQIVANLINLKLNYIKQSHHFPFKKHLQPVFQNNPYGTLFIKVNNSV